MARLKRLGDQYFLGTGGAARRLPGLARPGQDLNKPVAAGRNVPRPAAAGDAAQGARAALVAWLPTASIRGCDMTGIANHCEWRAAACINNISLTNHGSCHFASSRAACSRAIIVGNVPDGFIPTLCRAGFFDGLVCGQAHRNLVRQLVFSMAVAAMWQSRSGTLELCLMH